MTTERDRRPHLRLVVTNPERGDRAPTLQPEGRQLSFPYPEVTAFIFVYLEAMGREEFAGILGGLAPRWIFDVRTVPRLDLIAASRPSAFSQFERAKASYVDLFGRLGVRSYRTAESNPAFWGRAVFDILSESERMGPYLFLFDDEQLMDSAFEILPNLIKPVLGHAPQVAQLRHAAGSR